MQARPVFTLCSVPDGDRLSPSTATASLEPFMASWKQFCFCDGEANRQEGRAARSGATGKRPDAAGASQRDTLSRGPGGKWLRQCTGGNYGQDLLIWLKWCSR
jgi:hypothetical protein